MFAQRLTAEHSLREVALSDAEELFAVSDANRAYLRRWLPWLDRTREVADTRTYIEDALRQSSANQGFQALIIVGGQIAGLVGFHRIDWANRCASIGYWLAESYQRRGLMTRSCRALVDYGFASLNLNRIVINCAPANTPSRAIPERLGFVHEGRLREAEWLYDHYVDHEVYSQLQREWQTRIIAELSGQRF